MSIRFLLAGSRRYPQYITSVVLELLDEADKHQALAQQLATRRSKAWHEVAVRAARVRVEAQMLAAQSDIDFNALVRAYIRRKLRRERRQVQA